MKLSKLLEKSINIFFLILISAVLLLVPLKILSYGWSPNYAMLISATLTKDSNFPIPQECIEESVKNNKPIYDNLKEHNLIIIVTATFVIFNIIGLCFTENFLTWFLAMSIIMLANNNFIIRLLSSSPQILLCMLLMTILTLFSENLEKKPKTCSFCILLYIFTLRSFIPPEIYALDQLNISFNSFNSFLLQDIAPLLSKNAWLFFAFIVIWLKSHKNTRKTINCFEDSLLFVALVLQLLVNLGYNDLDLFRDSILLLWFSKTISEILEKAESFKILRVKICVSIFALCLFFLLSSNDRLGRFSKTAISTFPIDFSIKELNDWAPKAGGIIYNDDSSFAFSQYYENPDANCTYIYLNSFSIFNKEKNNIIAINKMLIKDKTPLPDYYEDWVEQMTPQDRLVTSKRINGLENIEWLQCGQNRWIGRLKNNM